MGCEGEECMHPTGLAMTLKNKSKKTCELRFGNHH